MNGKDGWVVIAVFVTVWDLRASDSLSAAFMRGHHKHGLLVITAYVVTTAHLFGKLPAHVDPFYLLLQLVGGHGNRTHPRLS